MISTIPVCRRKATMRIVCSGAVLPLLLTAAMAFSWPTPAGSASRAAQGTTQMAGDLDTTFGTGGKVTTDFGGPAGASAVALQSDGKIVVAGNAGAPGADPFRGLDFALARYNADGSLDTTFGTNGSVTTDFSGERDVITAVVILADGKILASGSASPVFGSSDFALARYNSDGTLDTSFGSGGKVTTDSLGMTNESLGMVMQSDGKMVLAGHSRNSSSGVNVFLVARYNTDGSLDTTFGGSGQVTTSFFNNDTAFDAVVQSDGKIAVAGVAVGPTTGGDFALARYNSDGSLDSSFGSGGKVTTDFFGGYDEALSLRLQSNGNLVAAGYSSKDALGPAFSATDDFAMVRYMPTGALDATFGTNGKVTTDFSGDTDRIVDLEIQSDGKLDAVGLATSAATKRDFALARYNEDGSLDSGFGTAGKVTTDFFGGEDVGGFLAIQSDHNLVAVGSATNASGISEFAVARYIGVTPVVVTQPDFDLSFTPSNVTAAKGTKLTVVANRDRIDGFATKIKVAAPAPPPTGFKFSAPSVSTKGDTASFTIKIKASAATGANQLIFTGTDKTGTKVHTTTLTVTVQ